MIVPYPFFLTEWIKSSALKLSEKPHERANLLAIKRLIATYMKASPLSGSLS
jgi:hypothetical protein